MSKEKNTLFPLERYRLVLYHEFIDCDGETHKLNKPITIQQVIEHGTRLMYGENVIINKMMDDLKEYLLTCIAEENY